MFIGFVSAMISSSMCKSKLRTMRLNLNRFLKRRLNSFFVFFETVHQYQNLDFVDIAIARAGHCEACIASEVKQVQLYKNCNT